MTSIDVRQILKLLLKVNNFTIVVLKCYLAWVIYKKDDSGLIKMFNSLSTCGKEVIILDVSCVVK